MKVQEHISLAAFTTLGVGGEARFFVEVHSVEEIKDAIEYAREHNLQIYPLGAGSNILVPDTGINGIVLKISLNDISFENKDDETFLIAGAGTLWEKIVDSASERNLFGIENLAGIPGTIGGASIQNIGAYGAEFSNVFAYADVIDKTTGICKRIVRTEAEFAYRNSFFKKHRELIIMNVALRFSNKTLPNIIYADLACAHTEGVALSTPSEISLAIRAIRAKKFPCTVEEGTAGSFFKNPVISLELADSLKSRFLDLPMFPQENGEVKISLAWLLDHALSLKGFSIGNVRLYEGQPLVIVANKKATASDIDSFACEIAKRVFSATNIQIEREVETFGMSQ